jgi:hypothetical protein
MLAACAWLLACPGARAGDSTGSRPPTPAVLSTDLSLDRDPDDWFDTLLFVTLPGIEPRGIILEHYASDAVLAETRRLLGLLGKESVPIAKGVQGPLQRKGDQVTAPPFDEGAAMIVGELERSPVPLTLIAVGGLTNEAMAYHRRPELFRQHVAAIYFVGGNLEGQRDMNASRDPLAVQMLFESQVPVVWIPCSWSYRQKLSGRQEQTIAAMGRPVTSFLTEMLAAWRKARPETVLRRTEQLAGQGKNLWSLPALFDLGGLDVGTPTWVRGSVHFSQERWTWFETDPRGQDRMLLHCDGPAACDWLVGHLQSPGKERPPGLRQTTLERQTP